MPKQRVYAYVKPYLQEDQKMKKIKELYWLRFNQKEKEIKNRLWKVLCRDFFQKFISEEDSVLDLGAGFCEFINNINCKNKYAVDINPELQKFANHNVHTVITNSINMKMIPDNSIDIVFVSEVFEHLNSTEELFETILEVKRILKKKGKLLILCPNIRYLSNRYWDFIDHHLPLSHYSLREGLLLYDFAIIKLVPKFLPYTTKTKLPKIDFLLKLYLKLPFIWNIFGKQMFICAINI